MTNIDSGSHLTSADTSNFTEAAIGFSESLALTHVASSGFFAQSSCHFSPSPSKENFLKRSFRKNFSVVNVDNNEFASGSEGSVHNVKASTGVFLFNSDAFTGNDLQSLKRLLLHVQSKVDDLSFISAVYKKVKRLGNKVESFKRCAFRWDEVKALEACFSNGLFDMVGVELRIETTQLKSKLLTHAHEPNVTLARKYISKPDEMNMLLHLHSFSGKGRRYQFFNNDVRQGVVPLIRHGFDPKKSGYDVNKNRVHGLYYIDMIKCDFQLKDLIPILQENIESKYFQYFVLRYLQSMRDALMLFLRAKVVHADLKPANMGVSIIRNAKGQADIQVYIYDFGTAMLFDKIMTVKDYELLQSNGENNDSDNSMRSQSKQSLGGTRAYCAPEVAANDVEQEFLDKIDLYSAGLTLQEMCSSFLKLNTCNGLECSDRIIQVTQEYKKAKTDREAVSGFADESTFGGQLSNLINMMVKILPSNRVDLDGFCQRVHRIECILPTLSAEEQASFVDWCQSLMAPSKSIGPQISEFGSMMFSRSGGFSGCRTEEYSYGASF